MTATEISQFNAAAMNNTGVAFTTDGLDKRNGLERTPYSISICDTCKVHVRMTRQRYWANVTDIVPLMNVLKTLASRFEPDVTQLW